MGDELQENLGSRLPVAMDALIWDVGGQAEASHRSQMGVGHRAVGRGGADGRRGATGEESPDGGRGR